MNRYIAVPLLLAASAFGQTDWPSFGNDPGAMRYSTLRQIDAGNVAHLKRAWTFRTGKPGSEAIPIVADGVMYAAAPDGVYALVPETGDLLWKCDAAPVALRGLAYWKDKGGVHSRVFVGNGPFLLALDVTTGKPAPGFGDEGRLDLKQGVLGDLKDGRYALQSPPAIFGDVVIRIEQRRRLTDRGRLRRRAAMGRPNGQVAVDLSHRPAARRTRRGDLAARCLEKPLRDECLGLLHGGLRARNRVPADRGSHLRLLRLGPRRRRALRQLAGGARCADRDSQVVSPACTPPSLGL